MIKTSTILILLAVFILPIISASDDQLTQVCGGDDELIIHCIGDEELNSLGSESKLQVEGGGLPQQIIGFGEKSTSKVSKGTLVTLLLIIFMIIILFFIVILKRKKRKV